MTYNLNISHNTEKLSFIDAFADLKNKIVERSNLPHATVDYQLDLLNQLSQFDMGKFLIINRGLNGKWTDYITRHNVRDVLKKKDEKNNLSFLENFMLNKSPTVLATQERFQFFKHTIKDNLKNDITICSLPCGIMGDIFGTDFSSIKNYSIIGVDIDPESLETSKSRAEELHLTEYCRFMCCDAWEFQIEEKIDILLSNGLNIYETNDNRVIDLYRRFYNSLKPMGILVTSNMTPLYGSPDCPWNLDEINKEDLVLEKILFSDIVGGKWHARRTFQQINEQLISAGFEEIEFISDTANIFPTVIARKH